jgi:CelD/BcsL family acetyltransferase involved in cellulose biosynthesis
MKPVVQVVRDREALEAIVPAWEELAAQACEANPFYEHWILLPALRAQGAGSGFRCVLVWEAERLIGLFPFERTLTLKGLPAATLTSWRHRSYLLCTPLVRADAAAECLQALFDWLPQEAAIAEFRYIPSDGAFHSALSEATRKAACTVAPTADFSRALLRKGVENCMSAQLRRQLRRKERRLAERPGFAVTKVSSAADIENFLALEASGWKAEAGGAFAASEASLRFGRAVLAEAQRRGRLHMVGIDCEQRAVARRVTILAGEGAYAFRTAYDESYAAYSPGMLAELFCLREFQQLEGVQWMDSYTDPDNPTVNRMWKDRRGMRSVAVGIGAWGELWVSMLPVLRWTARRYSSLRESISSARQNLSISR